MEGFKIYQKFLIDNFRESSIYNTFKNDPEYLTVFKNHLFRLSGPTHLTRKKAPADIFFSKLFYGFSEISGSYYSLVDIETYIGSFPYSKKKISRVSCMNYHIANYFSEISILRNRLREYVTTVGRLYKKNPNHADILKQTKPLFSLIKKFFYGISETRNMHVHERRFKNEDLARLSSLELLVEYGGKEMRDFKDLLEPDYRKIRKKYKNTFVNNNKEIKKLLDIYFETLYEIVTTKDGKLNYPKGIKI